jgi:branched-chain amino acid aminotransferase
VQPVPTLVENVRAFRGRLELLGEHARRLARSGEKAGLAFVQPEQVEAAVVQKWAESGGKDQVLRLELTATGMQIVRSEEKAVEPEALAAGLALVSMRGAAPAADDPARSLKLLDEERRESLLTEAKRRGADEGLRVDPQERVLGTAGRNVFFRIGKRVVTPSIESGAFPGIGRAAVLLAARALDLQTEETELRLSELQKFDDAFLVSSASGLVSVRSIDGRELAAPAVGEPPRSIVPRLRLRLHELVGARFLPE